ncbi:MAG: hypothetical protein JNK72_13930 [Myxococcales bacterium]|nr:hypothetical protein [Myxococcales bacterium]
MRPPRAALGLSLWLALRPARAQDFVRVEGAHFTLDGRPFRFVGANASVMHGASHRESLDAVFAAMEADHLDVARIWALGEQPEGAEAWSWDYAYRVGPEGWIERSFQHLDRALDRARAHHLRLIIVLANRWSDYGGVEQYARWPSLEAPHATLTPRAPDEALRVFLESDSVRQRYLAHVRRVVGRIDPGTLRPYRDDPTIMAWELINEAEAPPEAEGLYLGWTRAMARAVRALDPNHLVAAGHTGYVNQAMRRNWAAAQGLAEIDYADAHAYPTAHGHVTTLDGLAAYVDDPHALAAWEIEKPFVWGEFGFAPFHEVEHGVPRAAWVERFLEQSRDDGASGALAWVYTSSHDPPRGHGIWVDPPREGETLALRALLRAQADRFRATPPGITNPRIARREAAAAARWETRRRTPGPARETPPRRGRDGLSYRIAVLDRAYLLAESGGRYDGFALTQLWGSGAAEMAWSLGVAPEFLSVTQVRVRFRASAEVRGRSPRGATGPRSRVRVYVDAALLGEAPLAVDDGAGRWVELVSRDPAVLALFRARGPHTLRLSVPEGPDAQGLSVYGAATGREPVPPASGPPGFITLRVDGRTR